MRPIVPPIVTQTPNDPCSDSVTEHPAFAQVRANRHRSNGGTLYGSDFQHYGGVSITISRSHLYRGLSNDNYFERGELIRVELSEAQWARFVSDLNSGSGTPCTLRSHQGDRMVPGLPDPPSVTEKFAAEMNQDLLDAQTALKK